MVEQAAYNSDFLATFPLYYRDSPVPRRKRRRRKKRRILFSKRKRSFVGETQRCSRIPCLRYIRGERRGGGGREVPTLHAASDDRDRKRVEARVGRRRKKVYFALSWHRQCARRKRRRARRAVDSTGARRVYTHTRRDEEETVNRAGKEERERENKGTRVHTRHVRT